MSDINQLINETNLFIDAVEAKKPTLDAAEALAVEDANTSLASVAISNNAVVEARASADRAAGEAAIVDSVSGFTLSQRDAISQTERQVSLVSDLLANTAFTAPDLTGVNAAALHRSPNAITSMFVYDTSKDSDGGAWTEKCQHTSWYNEQLSGNWLGPQDSEFQARYVNASVGSQLITNGDFSNGLTSWIGTVTIGVLSSGGVLIQRNDTLSINTDIVQLGAVSGKIYIVEFDVISGNGNLLINEVFTIAASPGRKRVAYASTTTTLFRARCFNGGSAVIDNVSVREVTAINTQSNDYFQLSTDGKFYRLWKNTIPDTEFVSRPAVGSLASGASIAGGVISLASGVSAQVIGYGTENNSAYIDIRFNGTHTGQSVTWAFNISNSSPAVLGQTWTISAFVARVGGTSSNHTPSLRIQEYNTNTFLDQPLVQSISPTTSATRFSGSVALGNTNTNSIRSLFVIAGAGAFDVTYRVYAPQLELGSAATTYEAKVPSIGSVSEVFRGNKADFPRLAGIVAEASSVTIYDLTEAGRPMWMRFVASGGVVLDSNILPLDNITSLFSTNGIVVVSSNNTNAGRGGIRLISFVADRADNHGVSSSFRLYRGDIARRNNGLAYIDGSAVLIANAAVNAVAMTVLPNAPIDPVTNLPIPTIGVATGGGASVIRHDGVVSNFTSSPWNTNGSNAVSVSGDRFIFHSNFNNNGWVLLWSNNTYTPLSRGESRLGDSNGSNNQPNRYIPVSIPKRNTSIARTTGASLPITVISNVRDSNFNAHANLTHLYNTGWMLGDIRRCYMSDNLAGSISSSILINETFDVDTAGFVGFGVTPSSAAAINGELIVDVVNGGTPSVARSFSVVPFATYFVTVRARRITTNSAAIRIGIAAQGSEYIQLSTSSTSFVTLSGYFSPQVDTIVVSLGFGQTGNQQNAFDDLRIERVILDRSYRTGSANITGTLTCTQVAANTSLVGYSGWSANSYLQESYSSQLDFGTGEWTASAWVNIPTTLPDLSFPVIGSELITNGTFDTDTVGWTADWGTIAWVAGGQIKTTSIGSSYPGRAYQVISTQAGKVYRITGNIISATNPQAKITIANGTGPLSTTIAERAGVGSVSFSFVAQSNQSIITLRSSTLANGDEAIFDNISIREVGPAIVFDRSSSSGTRLLLGINALGQLTSEAFDGTTTRSVTSTATYNTGQWLKARVNYTTDGSLALMVNGREVAVTRGNPLLTLNNSNAVLTIGNSFTLNSPFPGSLALLKLSASIPTQEQATFMYEQEKQLFRDNAQCVLPDSAQLVDLSYDDATDRWVAVSPTNESYWTGLVRNSVTPVPAGSYTRVATNSGVELTARSTTNPGVDVTIPTYLLREDLNKRAEAANRTFKEVVPVDYVGGFTATTTSGSTAITSVANLTYPTSYIGARISGSGIPANTTITGVAGTTIYLSAAATASASGVSISFLDFRLPTGLGTETVTTAGSLRREGSTADYTRLYDGFVETVRFATAPGATAWVQIQAQRAT